MAKGTPAFPEVGRPLLPTREMPAIDALPNEISSSEILRNLGKGYRVGPRRLRDGSVRCASSNDQCLCALAGGTLRNEHSSRSSRLNRHMSRSGCSDFWHLQRAGSTEQGRWRSSLGTAGTRPFGKPKRKMYARAPLYHLLAGCKGTGTTTPRK